MIPTKRFFRTVGPYLLTVLLGFLLQISRARSLHSFHDIESRLLTVFLVGVTLTWIVLGIFRRLLGRRLSPGRGGSGEAGFRVWDLLRSFLERTGLYLCLVSFFFFTQIHWAKSHGHFTDLELRLLLAFLIGTLFARGLLLLLEATSPSPSYYTRAAGRLNLVLAPGILFILASARISFLVVAPLLCLFTAAAGAILSRRRDTPAASGHLALCLMAVVLALSLVLRAWGLDYESDHPDGAKQVTAAMRFVYDDYTYSLGHPSPDVNGYPYFAMHLVELSYRTYDTLFRHVFPHSDTPRAQKSAGNALFKIFLRNLARWLNVFYQLASIVLLYLVGRRLFGAAAGVCAAVIMAFSSLQIQMTHVVNADVPSAFFVLLCMFLAVRIRDRETPLGYLAAGTAAGLAAASKYHGIFALFFLLLVFLEQRARRGDWRKNPLCTFGTPLWAFIGFGAAFLLATPSLILEAGDTLAAITNFREARSLYNVPREFVDNRAALFVQQLPNHANSFLRFFEPLPGWVALGALVFFWISFRLRLAFLWIYPLVLFPLGNYAHNTSVSYHYLGILIPFYWITGYAAARILRAIKHTSLRTGIALGVSSLLFLGAASDASIFSLPPAERLARDWVKRSGKPEAFVTVVDRKEDRSPRILGLDLGRLTSAETSLTAYQSVPVAVFDLERRSPALNNCRNRPTMIFWKDDVERSLDLFPPPRRILGERVATVFPDTSHWSGDHRLFDLSPGSEVVRHIRYTGPSRWLLYAHYPSGDTGDDTAVLEVRAPWREKRFQIGGGEDILTVLDLKRPDLLRNRLFATVRFLGSQRLFLWLVSPQERGWFYVRTGRWRELVQWEEGEGGLASRVRMAVARHHLGETVTEKERLLEDLHTAGEDFQAGGTLGPLTQWISGVRAGILKDSQPFLSPFSFGVLGDEHKKHWPFLHAGSTLYGPYVTLVPGFYRVRYVLEGTGGGGSLEFRVTSEMGRSVHGTLEKVLPEGRMEVALPFRISPSAPGWNTEFLLVNQGEKPVRLVEIQLENDVEGQREWWIDEVRSALEGSP